MRVSLRVGATLAALALAGCNMVVSDEPWLVRGPDTPVMKPGVWVAADKPDCAYDPATAPEDWPGCADPAIVRADGTFLTRDKDSGKWRATAIVLSTGDPTVVQAALPREGPMLESLPAYIYLAMRPTARDGDGAITAITTWFMQCGPLDQPEGAVDDPSALVTRRPYAGLTVVDGNCHADSLAALTNAARESELVAKDKGAARWLRTIGDVATE